MTEVQIRTLTSRRGDRRIVILKRSDGSFVYRHQWHDETWGALGPICGIYASADVAEEEARARNAWLVSPD